MSDRVQNQVVNNFNGGAPVSTDLVPSIIFAAALGLTIPLLLWRLISRKHRSRVYANALMFFLIRTASMGLRAWMAKHQYGDAALIAELILTSIGYLFLINALIDLWEKHMESNYGDDRNSPYSETGGNHADVDYSLKRKHDADQHKLKWVRFLAMFLRLLLVAALVTAIAAGAILRKRISSSEKTKIISDLVKASYILTLATTALTLLTKLVTAKSHHRSVKQALFLAAYSIPLLIIGIYRVVEVFTDKYRATKRDIVAFFVAMILFEFLAYSMLLAISIPKWFENYRQRHARKDKEMGFHGINGTH